MPRNTINSHQAQKKQIQQRQVRECQRACSAGLVAVVGDCEGGDVQDVEEEDVHLSL